MYRILSLLVLSIVLVGCIAAAKKEAATPSKVDATESNDEDHGIVRLANGDWEPYTGQDLPGYGCDSRIITEVFSRMGYEVEYQFFPWARAMSLARNGEFDGTIEWADTPEWQKDFFINALPISSQEWVFFYRRDHPFQWGTFEDLSGKKIGVTSGFIYSNAFAELKGDPDYHFEEASSDEANFKKLLTSRIDIFPMERSVGQLLLQEKFSPEEIAILTFHPKPLATFEPRLLLTRMDPENEILITRFDEIFDKFSQESEYREILKTCQQ